MTFQIDGYSDVGRVRKNNEDAWYAQAFGDGLLLALVSDGVGGNNAGEVASAMVRDEFARLLEAGKLDPAVKPALRGPLLETALYKIHLAIAKAAAENEERSGMAATATVVIVDAKGGTLAQVGDSRLYRVADGQIEELSDDQTVAMELVKAGRLSSTAAGTHPDRNTLSQCLGLEGMDEPLAPVISTFTWSAGDRLLLCSDGISDVLAPDEIAAAALQDMEGAAEAVAQAALEAGSQDNATVILLCRYS